MVLSFDEFWIGFDWLYTVEEFVNIFVNCYFSSLKQVLKWKTIETFIDLRLIISLKTKTCLD